MSKTRRIWNILVAIMMIQAAAALMMVPSAGFILIAFFVGMLLAFRGIKFLIYYVTHAQHMTGGKWILLVGLIMFDLGIFAMELLDKASAILIIYVVAIHLIYGVLGIVRAVSNKKDGNSGWKIDFAQGIGNLILVALCLIFIKHVEIPVYIYGAGVIYSAVLKIITSLKKTAIVYVQ